MGFIARKSCSILICLLCTTIAFVDDVQVGVDALSTASFGSIIRRKYDTCVQFITASHDVNCQQSSVGLLQKGHQPNTFILLQLTTVKT